MTKEDQKTFNCSTSPLQTLQNSICWSPQTLPRLLSPAPPLHSSLALRCSSSAPPPRPSFPTWPFPSSPTWPCPSSPTWPRPSLPTGGLANILLPLPFPAQPVPTLSKPPIRSDTPENIRTHPNPLQPPQSSALSLEGKQLVELIVLQVPPFTGLAELARRGFVGLRLVWTVSSGLLKQEPVVARREAGWAPSGTSPVYRPAEQGSPMMTSNWMVINGDWPLPAAPRPSNITSPSLSPQGLGVDSSACTLGTGGLAYPPGLGPQDNGTSAPADNNTLFVWGTGVPPPNPVRTDRE
ncbi:hypothetical protein PtB15_8B107 [Puccinia triticina]|nr:hypothetical protein PtB15_8B107 [Puccinia triticina]